MKKLVFATLLLVAFVSCNKQQPQIDIRQENVNERNEYNAQISELAAVLNKALIQSSDFRSTVKMEAEKKFDGDINVLFSDLVKKTIKVETKSGNTQLSIGDYLNGFYNVTKSSSQSIVDSLQKAYPLLQVAIPVHSDEWDGSTPLKVAYVPYPFEEQSTKTIPAICPDGSWIPLDAKSEPNEPVIVLSQNERVSLDSINDLEPFKPILNPPAPENVNAAIENDYIVVSWDAVSNVSSYDIYRRGPNDNDFIYLGSTSGVNSTEYKDKSLSANCYYSYYVISKILIKKQKVDLNEPFIIRKSDPSKIVKIQAPSLPKALSYFETLSQGDKIEFRWNNDGIPDSKVNIYTMDTAVDDNYNLMASPLSSECNHITSISARGRRVLFKARRETNVGQSDPIYDFIYPPYRNTSTISPIYVNSISIKNLNDIEAWYSGAPEFYIKVFRAEKDSTGEYKTSDTGALIRLPFDDRTNSQSFDGALVYKWLVDAGLNWRDGILLYMIEGDNDTKYKFSAKISIPIKDIVNLEIGMEYCQATNSSFDTDGQHCGSYTIYYFENTSQILSFPSYGVSVEISDKA